MVVDVNPNIMVWAREEMGMQLEHVAEKQKLDPSDLSNWETSGIAVPFGTLESLAKQYKRQTSVFFLSTTPAKTKKPKDCRNLGVSAGKYSSDSLLAIRRTERYLDVAQEISGSPYWDERYNWLKKFDEIEVNEKNTIEIISELFHSEIDDISKTHIPQVAFRKWRAAIEEKLGIFIFQFPMNETEIDGFSYAFDNYPYAIVINNRNSAARKIFTIFHELFHIIQRMPCACDTGLSDDKNQLATELECNSFAGNFLVPTSKLDRADSMEEISLLARNLGVSAETYLRRMYEESMVSKKQFYEFLNLIKIEYRKYVKPKSNGAPSMLIQSKSTRGNMFFDTVVGAAATSKISFSNASDLLGLNASKIKL